MVYAPFDHRNGIKMLKFLQWNHFPVAVELPLEF